MDNEYLLNFLKEKNVATIKKKKHTYLTYYGLEQQDTYVLNDGVVKTSVILPDGREFNISYILILLSTHMAHGLMLGLILMGILQY